MAVFIRPKDTGSRIIPMHVMGDALDGEYVLYEMLSGESLKDFTHRDFIVEERTPIVLDPGGMLLLGPGYDVFTLQGERFKVPRTKLGFLVEMFAKEDLHERVSGFFRVAQNHCHVFISTMVLEGLVRKLRRLSDEFCAEEDKGIDLTAKECQKGNCLLAMVRESPPVGVPFWLCEEHGR